MSTLTAARIPTLLAPTELDYGVTLDAPVVIDPDPGPGSPTLPVPTQPAGIVQAVVLRHAVTHQRICELPTAVCTGWDDPHLVDTTGVVDIEVSTWEPCWPLLPGARTAWIGGRLTVQLAPDRYEVAYLEDGVVLAVGTLPEVPFDQDVVQISCEGPAGVLAGTMGGGIGVVPGQVGTPDALNGGGSFDGLANPGQAGWEFEGDIDWRWNTSDPLTGTKNLQIKGAGYAYGPWVVVQCSPHWRQPARCSTVVRGPSGAIEIKTKIYTVPGLLPTEQTSQDEGVDGIRDGEGDWTGLSSRVSLPKADGQVWMRMRVAVFSADWWDIAEVEYPVDQIVGSVTVDEIAQLPGRMVTQVQRLGAPDYQRLGLNAAPHTPTGIFERLFWLADDDVSFIEALRQVMALGLEVWVSPGWLLYAGPRRGRRRVDAALTPDNQLSCTWSIDVTSRIDEYKGISGFGSGPTRRSFEVRNGRHDRPRRAVVPVPPELSYRQQKTWTANQARWASTDQLSGMSLVTYEVGRMIGTGDDLRVTWANGLHGLPGVRVRATNRLFDPVGRTCLISWGLDAEHTE